MTNEELSLLLLQSEFVATFNATISDECTDEKLIDNANLFLWNCYKNNITIPQSHNFLSKYIRFYYDSSIVDNPYIVDIDNNNFYIRNWFRTDINLLTINVFNYSKENFESLEEYFGSTS